MIANIHNENFGYSVACDGYWAAVGNPSTLRYNPLTGSITRTGSVEVFKYNISTDVHDYKATLFRPLTPTELMLLSTEYANSSSIPRTGPYWYIHTEYTGSVPMTADRDLLVDVGQYFTASEDGYGFAVDLKDTLLAVGCPYFTSRFTFTQTGSSFYYTGSGYVDLFDLSKLDIDPYAHRISPSIIGSSSVGGFLLYTASSAANQDYRYIILQTVNPSIPNDYWQSIAITDAPFAGGDVYLQTYYTTASITPLNIRVVGIIGTNPYLTTIYNPSSSSVSESFGYSVSLNDEWLAVGSPLESGSRGSVFMFRKIAGDNLSWSFVQSLIVPSEIGSGDGFGISVEVNKASSSVDAGTSSFSWSMVVGSSKPSQSRAYVYEFDGTDWNHNFTLAPDNITVYPLPFYPTKPIIYNYPNYADWFGYDVSMYEDSVMVGAPKDRVIQEFESSSYYDEGAVYFFQRCPNRGYGYQMVRKSYGNEKIMKNNMLGWAVSIRNPYAVAGIPKITTLSSSICYLKASLFQEHFCESSPEASLQGQFILYNQITSSVFDSHLSNVDWDITNIYQVKKRYLSPYRDYGWDIDICEQFIIVGSPMLISGSNTTMAFYKDVPYDSISLSVASGSAVLNWVYNPTYQEQDGFNIEKSLDGITYNNYYILSSSVSRSYTDTSVHSNATYWYRINAFNEVGVSEYSNTASIFFPPPPPSNPITLSVHSGSYLGPAILTWSYTDEAQDGFNIEKSLDGITYNPYYVLANPSSRSYTDVAVSVGNTYWYQINAYNGYGVSPYSNTASLYLPLPIPHGTVILTVTTGSLISQSMGSGSTILSWTYPDDYQSGFNIEKSSSSGPNFVNIDVLANPNSRSYTDMAAAANSTYLYRVNAYNGYGTSAYSNTGSASLSNVLYLSGSEKFYVDPTGVIRESSSFWKGCFGYYNINMTNLDVSNNLLTTCNLISASALTVLTCSHNNLTLLDMRTTPSLYHLNCGYNSLTNLYLNSGSALTYLYCNNNQLTSLNVATCSGLSFFNCDFNHITSLDVTHNDDLIILDCNYNQLSTIDLTQNHQLQIFGADYNNLTSVNLSGSHPTFFYFTAQFNKLGSYVIDFDNTNLGSCYISNNNIPILKLGPRSASIIVLDIISNHVGSTFTASSYPHLNYLYAASCSLDSLDVTTNVSLSYLSCYGNELTSLDVSNNSKMWYLDCAINDITSLDASKLSNDTRSVINVHENWNLTSFSASISASYVDVSNTNLPNGGTTGLNQLYIDLDRNGLLNGTASASGSTSPPSGPGITARANLIGKGWYIRDNAGI